MFNDVFEMFASIGGILNALLIVFFRALIQKCQKLLLCHKASQWRKLQSAGVTTAFAFPPNPSLLFFNRFQNPPDPGKPLL